MTITNGSSGNKIRRRLCVAVEWREILRDNGGVVASSVVLQNVTYADVYWLVSTSPPVNIDEPAFALGRHDSITVRDMQPTDRIYARAHSDDVNIVFWGI